MKQIFTFHNQFIIIKYSINFQKSTDIGWGEYFGPKGIILLINYGSLLNIIIIENNFKIQIISFII
ncbi:MAG: hypothetical protein ACEY3K_05620 [Wolbachia sp.]